jgi:hypothetical protein
MGVGDVERSTVAVDKTDVTVDCGVVFSAFVVFRTVVVGGIDDGLKLTVDVVGCVIFDVAYRLIVVSEKTLPLSVVSIVDDV